MATIDIKGRAIKRALIDALLNSLDPMAENIEVRGIQVQENGDLVRVRASIVRIHVELGLVPAVAMALGKVRPTLSGNRAIPALFVNQAIASDKGRRFLAQVLKSFFRKSKPNRFGTWLRAVVAEEVADFRDMDYDDLLDNMKVNVQELDVKDIMFPEQGGWLVLKCGIDVLVEPPKVVF